MIAGPTEEDHQLALGIEDLHVLKRCIGDIDQAFGRHGDPLRPREGPRRLPDGADDADAGPVRAHLLEAKVPGLGDVQIAVRARGDIRGEVQLSGLFSRAAEAAQEGSAPAVEDDDLVVCQITHVDLVSVDGDATRLHVSFLSVGAQVGLVLGIR